MSLRLIKPGLSVGGPVCRVHPRTGALIVPIGYTKAGRAIWPVMGGAPDDDDPDDPDFTGQGGDDDEDNDDSGDDDSEEDDKDKGKKSKKDDDEDDEDKPEYTKAEYDKVKTRMRNADRTASEYKTENERLKAKLAKLNKGKTSKTDDDDDETPVVVDTEAKEREAKREKALRETLIENAFLRANGSVKDSKGNKVDWHDPEDALAVAEKLGLLDDVLDDDGTVDRRAMARALRELAKRKPHLVKKSKASGRDDDDQDEDDDQGSSRTPVRPMNGKRKGTKSTVDRTKLVKDFPALQRR